MAAESESERAESAGIHRRSKRKARSLHDLADEDVDLAVALFADFSDFVRSAIIAVDGRATRWRVITGRKIDQDPNVLTAAGQFKDGVSQSGFRPKDGAIRLGKIDDELSL